MLFKEALIKIHNFWAMDQKGVHTCCWLSMKTEGSGLSMDENWPGGNNMVVNPYTSIGQISLRNITTIISIASKTSKNTHFWKCVIVF